MIFDNIISLNIRLPMNANHTLEQIMTETIITVSPETSILEIENIFERYNFHHIPVIEKDLSLAGIISKTDLSVYLKNMSLVTSGKTFTNFTNKSTAAKDIMTAYPTTLEKNDTINLAADIFLSNNFHALPILENNTLIGIVTTHDLLKYAYKGKEEEI